MRVAATDKLVAYATFSSVGLVIGLAFHRVELVLLAAPFAAALVVGLAGARRPRLELTAELSSERALEGDPLALRLTVTSARQVGPIALAVRSPASLLGKDGRTTTTAMVDRPGPHRATIELAATRWGTFTLGPLAWQAEDPGRLLRYEQVVDYEQQVRIHPRPETLRLLVQPSRTTPFSGNHRAPVAGDGIEFAEVRRFSAGDRYRDVNPRVSARRGELFVTRRHPERHANVVVLLDTASDTALEQTVRGAVALVTAYAGQHDRVGVVAFGSMVRWVAPGLGDRHLYRVLDALLTSQAAFSYIWRDLAIVPPQMLPPNALVWLVSPLEDDRPAGIAYQLRSRGYDVSVLEIDLESLYSPGAFRTDQLAYRLWRLRRAARRTALRETGSAVVTWSGDRAMAAVIEQAAAFRARRRSRAG